MQKAPISKLVATVGAGDPGSAKAKELYIHLREGALPVNVEVIGSGQVTRSLRRSIHEADHDRLHRLPSWS